MSERENQRENQREREQLPVSPFESQISKVANEKKDREKSEPRFELCERFADVVHVNSSVAYIVEVGVLCMGNIVGSDLW